MKRFGMFELGGKGVLRGRGRDVVDGDGDDLGGEKKE